MPKTYGRILAVKIALVGLIAVISYVHTVRLRPRLVAEGPGTASAVSRRHWRLLRAEPVLGAGVIAAVALLVTFPLPPRQLGEAEQAVAATSACDPCPLPAPAADELVVADNAGAQVVAAWVRRRGDEVWGTVRVSGPSGKPSRASTTVLAARQRTCGPGCVGFDGARGDRLRVRVAGPQGGYVAALPTRWQQRASATAERLVSEAERAMRELDAVRQSEHVTSGPGSSASTEYELQAPDRMRFLTGGGVASIFIGNRRWQRVGGQATWTPAPPGPSAFSTRRWFRWSPYAQHVRLLGSRSEGQRRTVEIALFDPGTPVWLRLTLDARSKRVLRERSISKAHFTDQRYRDFNAPVTILAPAGDVG